MTVVRFHLLLGIAMIAAAGCAQQPERVAPPAAAVAPADAASAAAILQAASKSIPPRLVAFAYQEGYRELVVMGKTNYFCRVAPPMGSVIPQPICINELQLGAAMDTYYAWQSGGGNLIQSDFSPP